MVKYVIKRVLLMLFTLFVIMTMCFVLIKLLPLPALKEMNRDVNLVLAKREAMGYNKPIPVQFFIFLKVSAEYKEQRHARHAELSEIQTYSPPYVFLTVKNA